MFFEEKRSGMPLTEAAMQEYKNGVRIQLRACQWRPVTQDKIEFSHTLAHGCANHDTEGKRLKFPHPLLWRNEASLLDQRRTMYFPLALFAYTVCCLRTEQCFSVLRTHKSDAVDGSSGRRYVTAVDGGTWGVSPQYRDLRTRDIAYMLYLTIRPFQDPKSCLF